MTRCGCSEEDSRQSVHSPCAVANDESVVFVIFEHQAADVESVKLFSNNRLKDKQQSFCRAGYCSFEAMIGAVVGSAGTADGTKFGGYMWATALEVRAIVAERNSARDKDPSSTPKGIGAFCVIDDGEENYSAHARIGYANPKPTWWTLHDSNAARGNLLQVLRSRGVKQSSETPPFLVP